MAEQEFSYEQIEAFREQLATNLDTLFDPVTSGQEKSFTVDTFSLGLTSETTTQLSPENKTTLRKELYETLGIPTTEPAEPHTTYPIPQTDGKTIHVEVFSGNYTNVQSGVTQNAFLHELHYDDPMGDIGWVVSSTSEPPGELVSVGEGDKSDPNEPRFEDPSPIEVVVQPTTLEYALAAVNAIKTSFPEYAVIIDSIFAKGKNKGNVWLHQEQANEEGKFPAITITASPTAYKYNLGYIGVNDKGIQVFEIKDLPRCKERTRPNGEKVMEYPDRAWGFNADDTEKKEKSFSEMMEMLTLLREHGEF